MATAAESFAAAQADYLANVDYDLVGSLEKARLFIAACRRLIVLTPSVAANREERNEFSIDNLEKKESAATDWWNQNGGPESISPPNGSINVTTASFENFRT